VAEATPRPAGAAPSPASSPALSPAPVVSILVISYNTKAMTLDCLRSVAEQTTVPHEVIVLDNASPDGSAAAIAAAHPGMRLIASPENLGFARGNNVAAEAARGEYLLLLNPDTLVLDGAIDRIVAFAGRRPEAGIWGGRTLDGAGSLNPMSVFGDQTLWGLFCRASGLSVIFPRSDLFNPDEMGGWARDSERAVDVVQGSFLLIRRDLWRRLGGFDLTFVMYGEEADLCRRARALGARPRMTPEATIVHYAGASSRKRSDKEVLVLTARATLIRRHMAPWQRPLALGLLAAWPWTRMASGRLLARLTGRARFAEAAEHWGAVWRERTRWRAGFPGRGAGKD
jgi:GT2 family glycosyltransferase